MHRIITVAFRRAKVWDEWKVEQKNKSKRKNWMTAWVRWADGGSHNYAWHARLCGWMLFFAISRFHHWTWMDVHYHHNFFICLHYSFSIHLRRVDDATEWRGFAARSSVTRTFLYSAIFVSLIWYWTFFDAPPISPFPPPFPPSSPSINRTWKRPGLHSCNRVFYMP